MAFDKYVVYRNGYHPEQLCLGHLIIGPHYNDPVDQSAFCSPFRPLDALEAKQWTYESDWHGRAAARRGGRVGFGIEMLEVAHLSPQVDWSGANVLEAGTGRKVVLQDPQKFLKEKVLSSPEAEKALKRWMSTARTTNMLSRFHRRKPKIWMLTGLYELSDVSSGTIKEHHPSLKLGVSSLAIVAAGGPPGGASLHLGRDAIAYSVGVVHQPMVYAARYQLLAVTYAESESGDGQLTVELHPDNIYAMGNKLGGEDKVQDPESEAKVANLQIEDVEADDNESLEDCDLDPEYWAEFVFEERRIKRRAERQRC